MLPDITKIFEFSPGMGLEEVESEYRDRLYQLFVDFIESDEVAVAGTYTQTWTFIREKTNSLNRHSNLRILFEQENQFFS